LALVQLRLASAVRRPPGPAKAVALAAATVPSQAGRLRFAAARRGAVQSDADRPPDPAARAFAATPPTKGGAPRTKDPCRYLTPRPAGIEPSPRAPRFHRHIARPATAAPQSGRHCRRAARPTVGHHRGKAADGVGRGSTTDGRPSPRQSRRWRRPRQHDRRGAVVSARL